VQLEDGDIICFQKSPPAGDGQQQYCYPDVPSFFEYVQNRQVCTIYFNWPIISFSLIFNF